MFFIHWHNHASVPKNCTESVNDIIIMQYDTPNNIVNTIWITLPDLSFLPRPTVCHDFTRLTYL